MEKEKYVSVIDYIRNLDMKNDQNSTAMEYNGNKISRKEYWDYIDKYRNYFYHIGIQKQEPVAICMLNSPEYEFIFSSLLENGSIASTVSKSFLNADLNRQTIQRGIKTLILSIEFLPELIKNDTFSQLSENSNLERIILTTSEDFKKEEEKNIENVNKFLPLIKQIPGNIDIIYPGMVKKTADELPNLVLSKPNVLNLTATYSNTGGTTGEPKCACHTHNAIISIIKSHDKKIFKEFDIYDNSRSLLVIPISHITSQFYALLIRRAYGANIIYDTGVFDPNILRNVLINEKIDDVVLPFGLYYAITRKEFESGSLKINTPLCGGEPTPKIPTEDVNKRLERAGSNRIIIGTGSTEFGSGLMASYGIDDRCNESGYLFPFVDAFLVDPKTDKIITEPGKRGILYANAPWQMDCYLNDKAATDNFFNYTDSRGIKYGTNNDIVEIVGEHKGKPVYSMLGRASDFILPSDSNRYYPGIRIEKGKVQKVDFDQGKFLFDMRDVLINIPGVMEVQPILLPSASNSKDGYPVLNLTIMPNEDPKRIVKQAYNEFYSQNGIIPSGIIFRTKFERSLSSDKREVKSLKNDKKGYYFCDKNGKLYSVKFDGNKVIKEDATEIQIFEPPKPALVFSKRNKKS